MDSDIVSVTEESFSEESLESDGQPLGSVVILTVHDAWMAHAVVCHVTSSTNCKAEVCRDEGDTAKFELGIERMDRTDFTFWNQSPATAGPKQSWYKWNFSWLPTQWTSLPFTWRRLALNVVDDTTSDIPLPLLHHVIQLRIEHVRSFLNEYEGPKSHPIKRVYVEREKSLSSQLPRQVYVTASLTTVQARQLLHAQYTILFNADDRVKCRLAGEVCMKYLLHGHCARIFGPYEQSARFVGHGKNTRRFKNLPQYNISNLSVQTLNAIYQADGSIRGHGRRRSRSRQECSTPRTMSNNTYVKNIRHQPKALVTFE